MLKKQKKSIPDASVELTDVPCIFWIIINVKTLQCTGMLVLCRCTLKPNMDKHVNSNGPTDPKSRPEDHVLGNYNPNKDKHRNLKQSHMALNLNSIQEDYLLESYVSPT